jgi:UDP-2,3-diacylglucosamine pyrophosphatase LpxH
MSARIRRVLALSDVHLGWAVCTASHRELLDALPQAADDAELILLNGDIVDAHRGLPGAAEAELVQRLAEQCARWRAEGRQVVVLEGNHDPGPGPLGPTVWKHEFEGADGERVLVLHGHRFAEPEHAPGPYEHYGRHVIAAENVMYARVPLMRRYYGLGPGWFVGAWGLAEDRLWRPKFPARVEPLLAGIDVVVHGHFHFGPGRSSIAGRPAWRTGAWVARGHLGTVNRMLRYRDGTWQRIGLSRGRWTTSDDGR